MLGERAALSEVDVLPRIAADWRRVQYRRFCWDSAECIEEPQHWHSSEALSAEDAAMTFR